MICLLSTWLYFSGCNLQLRLYCSGYDLQPRIRNLTGLSGRDDFGRDLTGLTGFNNLLFGIYQLLFWKSERIILIINA